MKIMLTTIACLTLASLALAQQATDNTTTGPTTTVRNQMTGKLGIGTVDAFTPGESITVVTSANTHPVKYVMAKAVRFENPSGGTVNPRDIRAGTKVSLAFNPDQQVDRVIVVDQTGAK